MKRFLIVLCALLIAGCSSQAAASPAPSSFSPTSPAPASSAAEAQNVTQSSSDESSNSTPPKEPFAGIGDTLDCDGLQLTLSSAEYYDGGTSVLSDDAEEGKRFIVLWFVVSNTTSKDDHINMFYEESYCDDFAIDPEIMMLSLDDKMIWGDIAAGKKVKGYVAYQVPLDWKKLEFYYTPSPSEDKMRFIVTSDQLG